MVRRMTEFRVLENPTVIKAWDFVEPGRSNFWTLTMRG